MTGLFITLEGGEGSGKSTQLQLLSNAFLTKNLPCLATREPGGTSGAERIRALLVNGDADSWEPLTETLLFYAARLDHVNRLIKPALALGKTVLCDRFADSTRIYQGIGKQVDEACIDALHRLTLGTFMPDLTLILDIEPSIGLARATKRSDNETRFEQMQMDFHQRIRNGFLQLARREPNRCVVVNAAQDKQALHGQIAEIITQRLGIAL